MISSMNTAAILLTLIKPLNQVTLAHSGTTSDRDTGSPVFLEGLVGEYWIYMSDMNFALPPLRIETVSHPFPPTCHQNAQSQIGRTWNSSKAPRR